MELADRVRLLEEEVAVLRTAISTLVANRAQGSNAPSSSPPRISEERDVDFMVALADMFQDFLIRHKGHLVESPAALVVQARLSAHDKQLRVVEQAELREETDPTLIARQASVLSNAFRVQILQSLLTDDRSASEFTSVTGLEGGPLYHHLSDLQSAGLVKQKGRGRYTITELGVGVFYQLATLFRHCHFEVEAPVESDE